MSSKRQYIFFATVAPSLEGLLASEVESLGAAAVEQGRGSVTFKGTLEVGYKVCLWTRVANHVLIQLKTFPCTTREELYENVHNFPWQKHFSANNSFTIKSDLVLSELSNTNFVAQVTKDAIVDYFRDQTGQRPSIDNEKPELRLHLYIERNQAVMSLDISGTSLHQRAYRVKNVKATLKENIAAVLLLRAHWPKWARNKETFVDPLCGSGTLAIEAAMIAADMAPGLLHPYYGSPAWLEHDQALWQSLISEAETRKNAGLKNMPAIYALDKDPEAFAATLINVRQAGLSEYIRVIKADVHKLAEQPITKTPHGLIALNPPYGKRLNAADGAEASLKHFYKELGQILYESFPGWDVVMLTASEELTKSTGLRAHKVNSLYNGPIKCIAAYFYLTDERRYKGIHTKRTEQVTPDDESAPELLTRTATIDYSAADDDTGPTNSAEQKSQSGTKKIILKKVKKAIPATAPAVIPAAEQAQPPLPAASGSQTTGEPVDAAPGSQTPAGMFINRLKRNMKQLKTWRKKENITCYRLYDKDMPEFAVAIDIFEEKWVHVQEYVAPREISPQKTAARLKLIMNILPDVLHIEPKNIFLKARLQQKGRSQYNKLAEKKDFKLIKEGGYKFYANFTDYLDVGIFLDHRPTRALIRKLASGKRFLNLYCYTSTATVYAAKGGALKTISVDASNTYLNWARNNFLINELDTDENILICADCMEWLSQYAGDKKPPFDLIFIDPPTFSNNKTKKRLFDVQKDHVALLRLAASVLSNRGIIIFSTNFRKFKLEQEQLPELYIEDISRQTIPPDYQRNKRIHYCWQITKK